MDVMDVIDGQKQLDANAGVTSHRWHGKQYLILFNLTV